MYREMVNPVAITSHLLATPNKQKHNKSNSSVGTVKRPQIKQLFLIQIELPHGLGGLKRSFNATVVRMQLVGDFEVLQRLIILFKGQLGARPSIEGLAVVRAVCNHLQSALNEAWERQQTCDSPPCCSATQLHFYSASVARRTGSATR